MILDSYYRGKRLSVSIDDLMWEYYVAGVGDKARAVALLKNEIKDGFVKKSADARAYILRTIARPSIVAKVVNSSCGK